MWTKNFQMFKLDTEKAEEAEINLSTSVGSYKKQKKKKKKLQKNITKAFDYVDHNKLWKIIAAAAAKSLQSCPTRCNPIDSSPPGSPIPGILQARTLEWVAISFSNAWKWKVKVKSLSRV